MNLLESFRGNLMISEQQVSDLGYLIKFKRNKNNETLTVRLAQECVQTSAAGLQALLDSSKQMRALLPKQEKE